MATYVEDPRVTINGQNFTGASQVRVFHDRFGFGGQGAFSNVNVVERRRHSCGLRIIIEQTLSGIHTGKWQGIEATGRAFSVPVCTIYDLREDGKLIAEDVYFDASSIFRQLGADRLRGR